MTDEAATVIDNDIHNEKKASRLATIWSRLWAVIIDNIIFAVATFVGSLVLGKLFGSGLVFNLTNLLFLGALFYFYYIDQIVKNNQTLGKRLLKIKIVGSDGRRRLSVGQALLRELVGKPISGMILLLGYVMAIFTDKHQALHDYIAKTVVINVQRQE